MPTKYPLLKVEKRKILGHKVKSLRKEGILAANLYGKTIKSLALQLKEKEFLKIFKEAGETGLVELTVGGEKTPHLVLIHNPQKEPVDGSLLHVDFRQVDLKQKITAMVPVEMLGEAPGVAAGGVLVQLLNEVEIEALPTDLPEKITVKIAKLQEIGQAVTVADLIYDKDKVELKAKPETLVVKIEAPAKEEVEVKPAAEAAPTTEGEAAKPAEGEKPKEEIKETKEGKAAAKPAPEAAKKEEKK